MPLGTPRVALVREPSDAFASALAEHTAGAIDPERARAQHREFRRALGEAGVEVVALPPEERFPDACFVEDTAVVLGGRALVTRPGAPSRRGEEESVAAVLPRFVRAVERVRPPAAVDGGDVLPLGDRVAVGRSTRTNADGMEAVRAFAAEQGLGTVAADVPPGVLHLRTGVSALPGGVVLGLEEMVSRRPFERMERIAVPPEERPACNVLVVGRTAIVAAGFPATRRALERRGLDVREVDLSEFAKADGGPTCLTVLVSG